MFPCIHTLFQCFLLKKREFSSMKSIKKDKLFALEFQNKKTACTIDFITLSSSTAACLSV